jgi:hypothetical protein
MSCNVDVAFVGGAMMKPSSLARYFFLLALLALLAFLPCAAAAFVAAFAVSFLGLPIRMGGRVPDVVVGVGGGEGVVVKVGLRVGPLGLSGRLGDRVGLSKGKRGRGRTGLRSLRSLSLSLSLLPFFFSRRSVIFHTDLAE